METTKDRLKAYLAKEQIKHSEFCKRIGVSQAFVSSMRKGISPDKVELIRKEFPDLSLAWLLTGQGSMYNCKNDYNAVIDDACVNYSNSLQLQDGVPFFDIEPAACGEFSGFGEAFTSNNIASRIVLPDVKAKAGDIFIKTKGRSMVDYEHPELSIPEGAIVLIREWSENYIAWGELYCVMTRSGYAVKRLMPGADDAHVSCVSADSDHYPPYTIALTDIVGIARVIGILTYKTV